jgi:outer membrane immunogenic protein
MYKISKLAVGSVIAATAALGGTSVALADGYVPRGKVVYERPSDWSGVYFGVSSGYQWSNIGVTSDPPAAFGGYDFDTSSSMIGAHLGIQHQFGAIVLGVEGGWNSAFRDKEDTAARSLFCGLNLSVCSGRLNDIITIGGRVGYAAGHWMPYVSGGYASARFENFDRDPANGNLLATWSSRNSGWYAGGGVDWSVSPGWIAGIEYRHYEFDNNSVPVFTPAGALATLARVEGSTDTLMARVSWKFGREVAAPLK